MGATTLRLRVAAGRNDLLPPAALPVRYKWRGVDAGVYAYGYANEETWWLRWPKVGTFRMVPGSAEVAVVPDGDASAGVLQDAFRRGVTPVALLQRDLEVLHASAVLVDGRVIALCAVSGTGKSTLAAALGAYTAPWADDFVAWSVGSEGVLCDWFPSAPRLSDEAASVLDETAVAGNSPIVPGFQCSKGPGISRAPLGGVLILERGNPHGDCCAAVERIEPSEAFTAVLTHAHECGLGDASRHRASVERHLELAARVPVYRVVFRPDLARLSELAGEIHAHVRMILR